MALFGAASVGCAAAPSLAFLVAARVVQAAAGAILIPTSLGLALPVFPPRERATVMGIWTAVAATGAGCGPVAGGLLLAAAWRWIFLLNVPVVAVAVIAGRRQLPASVRGARTRLDLPGAALVLATTAALTTAFVQTPAWGYGSPATLGCVVAAILLGALTLRHLRRDRDPVISPTLFRHRLFAVAVSAVFLYYLVFAAMLLAATLFLTGRWHYSVVIAALGIAPVPLACMATAPLSGRIVARIGGRASAVRVSGRLAAEPDLCAAALASALTSSIFQDRRAREPGPPAPPSAAARRPRRGAGRVLLRPSPAHTGCARPWRRGSRLPGY